jgi:hypothetical protein
MRQPPAEKSFDEGSVGSARESAAALEVEAADEKLKLELLRKHVASRQLGPNIFLKALQGTRKNSLDLCIRETMRNHSISR